MSNTLVLSAGQVFTGTNVVGPGVTGMFALTQSGTVAFNTSVNPPQISGATITHDVAGSSATLNGAVIQSVTVNFVVPNEKFELYSELFPFGTNFPSGFQLPQIVRGWGLGITVETSRGTFAGQAGLFGVNGTLAYVVAFSLSDGFQTLPTYTGAVFSLGAQLTGNVSEAFPADFTVACFVAGTRIATSRGDVAVECLRPGDQAQLAGGGTMPIVWTGHRRVDCLRHPRPHDVLPVRVAAHAFGVGRPRCDVWLSPDHAVFADGVLIPVRYLMNGATVDACDTESVTYWHVELERHGVLLAEGLPAESYLDTGNRVAFAGGGTIVAHPDFARHIWAAESCAPLILSGHRRDTVHRRLLAQAGALGHRPTDERDLRVVADGRELFPVSDRAGWSTYDVRGDITDSADPLTLVRAGLGQFGDQ